MVESASRGGSWPPRQQARWALLLLLLAYILSFIDRIILSILIRPISTDLGLTDMQFALVGGVAFSLFYVTVGLPIGWLVDRISRRVIVAAGIALWSLCTIASGLAPSFGWLFLARVGVGIGEAALSPAAYSLIADYFPPEKRGRAVAIYTLGVSLGSSVAYLVGGALISFASGHGGIDMPVLGALSPWRFVFAATGLPGLLLAAVTLTMREPPRRSLAAAAADGSVRLLAFLRANRRVSACYILGYSFINLPFAGFLLWGPALFGRLHDMGPGVLALPLALIFLVPTTLGQWLGALMTDRAQAAGHGDAAFRTGMWCAAVLVPVSIAMPLLANAWAALATLAILVFLVCASVGHHAVVAAAIAPNRLRGIYVALFFFVQNVLGQAVIALVTAFLTDHVFGRPTSLGLSMAIVGGVGAAAGFATLTIGRAALRRSVSAIPS
ncbi:MFS family permease [Sphingomonas zeicaulis]|uniref:MFS transporter n=1 Tax=Sphingomonas zeicaulis TaxID=1632740 RepID=UPI003D1AFFA6